jgi:transposase
MARAYSDDLRRKILQIYEHGKVSCQKVAERFGVSDSYVHNLHTQFLKTGKMERVPQSRNGRPSRLTPEIREKMRAWIVAQPDLTLAELQRRLAEEFALTVSSAQIWLVLKAMGLRLKKSHSMRANRKLRRGGRSGKPGRKPSAR